MARLDQTSSHQDLNPQQKVGSESWENNRDVSAGVGTGKEIALRQTPCDPKDCQVQSFHLAPAAWRG